MDRSAIVRMSDWAKWDIPTFPVYYNMLEILDVHNQNLNSIREMSF